MKIQNKHNGGVAIVSDEYGERLIASGDWKPFAAPKPAPAKKTPTKVTKTEED